MNDNNFNSFNNSNSFNNGNFNPNNNTNMMNNQSQFINNTGMNMNGNMVNQQQPVNNNQPNQPMAPVPPDEMIGPNPFDAMRNYDNNTNIQTTPFNNTFINPMANPMQTENNAVNMQSSNNSQMMQNNFNQNFNQMNTNANVNPQMAQTGQQSIQNNFEQQTPINGQYVQPIINPIEQSQIPADNNTQVTPTNQFGMQQPLEQSVVEQPQNGVLKEVPTEQPEIPSENNLQVSSANQEVLETPLEQPEVIETEVQQEVPTEQTPVIEQPQNEETPVQEVSEETFTPEEFVQEEVVQDAMTIGDGEVDFESRFKVDYENAISKNEAIYKGEKYRITVLSEILVRLEYSETGTFEDRPTELAKFRNFEVPKVEVIDDEKMLTLKTSYFELTYEKEKPFTGTKFSPDQYLKVKLLDTDRMWFFGHAEARNFKSTSSNLDNCSSLPKLEKGLYSTDGFVSIDDSKTLIFNQDGSVGKRSDVRIDTYLFLYKKDFGFCLKDYYKLTGYPPLIPRYALGVWWNRDESYNVNDIYSLIAKFKKYEIPISVLLLNKWSKNDVTFDKEQIPEPKNLIDNLHSDNIKLAVDLKLESVPASQNGERVEVPFNVYDKAFVANYFNTFIKPLNDMGVDFYSIDYRGNDLQILRMMNYYFYNYTQGEPNKRGIILSRNGLINSHLYPINKSGDTIVDWKTLKMIPEFNSTSSNLGISWWSHAIGGFKDGVEESELYTRFVQLGTYSPIFRFSAAAGHYYKREPWKWDVKTRKIVKDYTNLRHKIIPYLYSESYKYSKTGLPLIQPLYYRYPELYDEPTYRNEYYFGTELFIAPITERKDNVMNRTVVKLFLPNGMWYDFKTGKKYPGGKRYISFFQDEDYPVFAKQGAIIPEALIDDENRNFTGNPEEMEIHIFPGKNNTYKLYEDDGTTNAYKNGEYMLTSIDYNYLPNNYTVIIRTLEGKDGIIPDKRKYKIRFRNTRHADDVIVYLGSEKIDVKSYLDDQDFIVETDLVDVKEQLSVNCKGKDIEIDAVRIINEDIDTIISDLKIPTRLKEEIAEIMFSEQDVKKKRIEVRKLSKMGLNDLFVKMFLKLLEYVGEF